MDRLNKELRDEAVGYGLCKQWQGDWLDDKSQQELITMYKDGLDFCIENNYPSITYIKKNFDKALLRKNLIFVDEDVTGMCGKNGIYVLNGGCSGSVEFKGFTVATLYVRHTSEITVNVRHLAKVFISVYDKAKVSVTHTGAAKVYVYRRGYDTTVSVDSDVRVRDRFNS